MSPSKPNACNLCHLDKTSTWAEAEMARLWRGVTPTVEAFVPASVMGVLMGDAAERVIWADAFGDPDAIKTSGDDWELPVLAMAERDPYSVIRFIARRSAGVYRDARRELVTPATIGMLIAHRDDRDVYVAE